jgi:hypothetical protein
MGATPSQHEVPDEGHTWPQAVQERRNHDCRHRTDASQRIRKGQCNLATLDLKFTTTPAVWNVVLSDQ